MRVDVQYERYSLEFVGRVVYATSPAFVILAAHGAMWAWRANIPTRFASAALVAIGAGDGGENVDAVVSLALSVVDWAHGTIARARRAWHS